MERYRKSISDGFAVTIVQRCGATFCIALSPNPRKEVYWAIVGGSPFAISLGFVLVSCLFEGGEACLGSRITNIVAISGMMRDRVAKISGYYSPRGATGGGKDPKEMVHIRKEGRKARSEQYQMGTRLRNMRK